eukprot:gene9619-695_t
MDDAIALRLLKLDPPFTRTKAVDDALQHAADSIDRWLPAPPPPSSDSRREPDAGERYDPLRVPPREWVPEGDPSRGASRWDQAGRLIELQDEQFAEQRAQSKAAPPDREERLVADIKEAKKRIRQGAKNRNAYLAEEILNATANISDADVARCIQESTRRWQRGEPSVTSKLAPAPDPESHVINVAFDLCNMFRVAKDGSQKPMWLNHEQVAAVALCTPVIARCYARALECSGDLGNPPPYGDYDTSRGPAQTSMLSTDQVVLHKGRKGERRFMYCPGGDEVDWGRLDKTNAWRLLQLPMRLFVGGAGGCGKTHVTVTVVVKGMFQYFLGDVYTAQLLAPTNRAACLLGTGANTVDSFTQQMSVHSRQARGGKKDDPAPPRAEATTGDAFQTSSRRER